MRPEKDPWIPLAEVDFANEKIQAIYVDTRDFHCLVLDEKPERMPVISNTLLRPDNIDRFFYTADEVKNILFDLYARSGGEQEWRFLSFLSVGDSSGSDWGFKYIRVYKTSHGFVMCNSGTNWKKPVCYRKDTWTQEINTKVL